MKVPQQARFFSEEVEKNVIGAVLQDTDLAQPLCNMLRPVDFFIEAHSLIWGIITSFALEAKPFTIFEISDKAKDPRYGLKEGTIFEYLNAIHLMIASSAFAERHAQLILDYSQRRRAVDLVTRMQAALNDADQELEGVLLSMESEAVGMRGSMRSSSGLRVVPNEEWIRDALEAYDKKVYRGESTGWSNLDEYFMVGGAQVTVVTGIPNHGKSEFLDAMMLNLATGSGWQIGYWSPENNPLRRHVQKLAEKSVGKYLYGNGRMTLTEYHKALHETISRFFRFLDQGFSGATFDQVLLEFGKMNPRPNAVVIDPWNRLEIPSDSGAHETEYIRQCLTRATRFASTTGIHVFIVAHPQKLQKNKDGKRDKPGLYDISGSAHWANIVDNGIMVWRDFAEKKTEIHLLKVRFKDNGHPGMTEMKYEMSSGRYSQYTQADAFSAGTEPPARGFSQKGKGKAKASPQTGLQFTDRNPPPPDEEPAF